MPLIITPRQLTRRSHFYQQLGQLTAAGVTLVKALEMLERNPPSADFRAPIRELLAALSQGATFADALRRLGRWMPDFDIALIHAGEQSGRLDAVCKLLANYYEERARLIMQTVTELGYPALVLHMAIFIFPFIDWFRTGNTVAFLLKTFGVLGVIYGGIFLLIFAAQGRHGAAWRTTLEKILRPVPLLGAARQSLALARIAAALEALTNAGVTIVEAWELAAAGCGSSILQKAVLAWKPAVLAGQTPAEAVKQSPAFPELFGNLYYSGEVSGQLDETLRRLHTYYEEEGIRKMRLLARWVPRMIYFAVVLFTAYKIVSFYSNMYGPGSDLDKILKGN